MSLVKRASARVKAYSDILSDDFLDRFDQWETEYQDFLADTRPEADQPPDPGPPTQKRKGPGMG